MHLRVLTLNIWGVHYVSKFITERIQALIEYLKCCGVSYDIIGLQEVWSKADYIYLRDQLKSIYPYSYYFLSGRIGSGCCTFSKHEIIGVYERRYSLNGFPHKVQHGDWFCGKLIGLCKILVNGHVVNVYNTHLHANYHHVPSKDIYLEHRICQAYELTQFIESTSSADTTEFTVLLGDLNLRDDELGFKIIKGILRLNDSFLERIHKNVYDPTVGNSGRTSDLLDNPYINPHPYEVHGQRIDYILYRSRNDNMKCLECYPTLHKVPNNSNKLYYSDHLAVYALFEIDEDVTMMRSVSPNAIELMDEETRSHLLAACALMERSIDHTHFDQICFGFLILLLLFISYLLKDSISASNYFSTAILILRNSFCFIIIAFLAWMVMFGKPVERNCLNAMKISDTILFIFTGILFTTLIDVYSSLSSRILIILASVRFIGILIAIVYRIVYDSYDPDSNYNHTKAFWMPFKNIFVVVATIEQAFVVYYIKLIFDFRSILFIIQQVSMPLFTYLWIRRIEKENLIVLQEIWLEIFSSTNDHCDPSKRKDELFVLKRLFQYSLPDWKIITFGTMLLLSAALSEIFVPLYTGRLLSSVAFKATWSQFQHNLIMFVLINFAGGFLGGFRMGVFSVCISRLNIRLRTKLFQSYLQQEIGFFDMNDSGKLLSRLTHDTQIMSSTVANNISQCIGAFVRFFGTVIMMIKLSVHLTIACLIGAPIILFVAKISGNAYRRISEKVQNLSAEALDIAEEAIQTIRTVRSFGNEDEELRRFENILEQSYRISLIQAALTAIQKWFVELAQLFMSIVMLSYGAKLVRDDYVTGPDLLAFIIYQLTLGGILSDISQIYGSLMTAVGASQSVFDYLDRIPKQKANGNCQPDDLNGDIEFDNVSLVYPARPDEKAIKNISFKIQSGQTCAFVGPSGSGKSTCINLLERFYDPTQGRIVIDGRDIHDYEHRYLHRQMAMVGQEPILFNRTIEENINYAVYQKDEAALTQTSRLVNAHGFISELSNGYNTKCGKRGGLLSGGEKQRICIARAIIRQPKILLLDEATSALDSTNEKLIQDALFYKNDKQRRTVLISAHRLSTIERCDRIFVIHRGQLIEQGTHDELMAIENGVYRELVRRQRTNIDEN